ncbi:MAG: hypothetical protein GPJ54_11300 [Candidatus Heimdallarchaeota archaeon]|nr:hypothetical protein [Candidatus Heimdallarchaeota archaeon]
MSYTIKKYEEGFIEQQVELGNKITSNWIGYNMSSVESIKNSYSEEGFDPETRLYAFKDDKMVGFQTSYIADVDGKKEAHYRLPILLDNHEEAAKQLIEKSIEVIRKKGAEKIITTFKEDWGNHKNYVEMFNFELKSENSTTFALSDVNELVVPETTSEHTIQELDLEKHGEALIRIFRDEFGLTQEAAENNFNLIKSFDQSNIISHSVIFKGDVIIGRLLLYNPYPDADVAFLGNIYAESGNEELFYDLFVKHLVKKAKEKGVSKINKTIMGDRLQTSRYEKYGFKFDNVIQSYEKQLN